MHFLSKVCVLFSSSGVKVHDSQVFRNMDVTTQCNRFTFYPRNMLSFSILDSALSELQWLVQSLRELQVLSLHLKHCSKVLEACHCSELLIFNLDPPLWRPLICLSLLWSFSARVSNFRPCAGFAEDLLVPSRASSSYSYSAGTSMSSANRGLLIVLLPMLIYHHVLPEHQI